jgi:hypothetical protein
MFHRSTINTELDKGEKYVVAVKEL